MIITFHFELIRASFYENLIVNEIKKVDYYCHDCYLYYVEQLLSLKTNFL